jgi:hypothetical protein
MPDADQQRASAWDAARQVEKSIRDDSIADDVDTARRLAEALAADKSPTQDEATK